jgi:hypothetical protein
MSKKLSLSLSQLCAPSSSKLVGRDISTAMNKRRLKTKMRNKRERERQSRVKKRGKQKMIESPQ